VHASFESPAAAGLVAASGAINLVLGESLAAAAVQAMPTKALITGGKSGRDHYAQVIARNFRRKSGTTTATASFSTAAAIPAEYLGVTFTYNAETDQYEASDLTGAPANGVRFLVYATNPISGQIIEPLAEVGYADIVATSSESAATMRIELVSDDVTYLDYTLGATYNTDGVTVTVSGFVSNGDDRVNYDLDTHLSDNSLTVDYTLVVPTRGGFRIDFEGEVTQSGTTSTLEARGPHGTVTITGNHAGTSGTFEVEVNGELFATISYSQSTEPVITGADGQPLSAEELEALQKVFEVFIQAFIFADDLLNPLAN
jgi:hypothetical protein